MGISRGRLPFALTPVTTGGAPRVTAFAISESALSAVKSARDPFAGKTGDFKQPEMDFEAFDPGTGNVFTWSFNEAS